MKNIRRYYIKIILLQTTLVLLFSCSKEIVPNENPSLSTKYTTDGLKVTLTVSSFDNDGTISEISIDWGDSNIEQLIDGNLTDFERTHLYSEPSNYTIQVTATDLDSGRTCNSLIVPVDFKEVVLDNIKKSMFKISSNEYLILTINLHTYQENEQNVKFNILTEVIGQMDIDFITFQECAQNKTSLIINGIVREDNMALIITDNLKEKFNIDYNFEWDWSHYGWNVWEEGVAVLSKYPLLDFDSRYISTNQSKYSITSRKTVFGSYQLPNGRFNLFSAHTHWRTSETDNEQNKQIRNIQQMVDEKDSLNSSIGTFVCGDFNGNPTSSYPWSEGYNTMVNDNEYIDTFLEIYPDANDVPPNSNYNTVGGTYPGRIDYIFMKNNSMSFS